MHAAALPGTLWLCRKSLQAKALQKQAQAFRTRPALWGYLVLAAGSALSSAAFSMAVESTGGRGLPVLAVIQNAWPLLCIGVALTAPRLAGFRKPPPLQAAGTAGIAIAAAGIIMTALAKESGDSGTLPMSGLGWAFAAAALGAGTVIAPQGLGWQLREIQHPGSRSARILRDRSILVQAFMHMSGLLLSALLGLAEGETLPQGAAPWALGMGLALTLATLFFRGALSQTHHTLVLTLSCLTPVFATGLLLLFEKSGLAPWEPAGIHWLKLTAGTLALTLGNAMIQRKASG